MATRRQRAAARRNLRYARAARAGRGTVTGRRGGGRRRNARGQFTSR